MRAGFLRAVRALAMGDFAVRLEASDGISEQVAESFNAFAKQLQRSALHTNQSELTQGQGAQADADSLNADASGSYPAKASENAFVGALSHEFRTPLNAILGWTQLLRSAELDNEKQVSALESIDRNARTLAMRLAEFLDTARVCVAILAARSAENSEAAQGNLLAREGMDLP